MELNQELFHQEMLEDFQFNKVQWILQKNILKLIQIIEANNSLKKLFLLLTVAHD